MKSFAIGVLLPNVALALVYGISRIIPLTARTWIGVPLMVLLLVVQLAVPFIACAWYPARAYERQRSALTLSVLIGSLALGLVALWLSFVLSMRLVAFFGGSLPLPL